MTSQSPVRYETQDDFATEPVRGLPEMLPKGERILWQGAPDWQALALSAYHVRAVSTYFAALLLWRTVSGVWGGEAAASLVTSLGAFAGLALAAVGTLLVLGYLAARSTVYTITNRRLVMRIGIALPMTLNLPFKVIAAASARIRSDGVADIPLQLVFPNRLAFLVLWPHCRPWSIRQPQPMLRCVRNGTRVAQILADALKAHALAEAAKATASPPPAAVASEAHPSPMDTAAA